MSEIESLFRRLSAGIYIVGAAHNEQRDAFTAAWIMQISFDPLLLALSINPQHASYPLVRDSGAFSVTRTPATWTAAVLSTRRDSNDGST